MSLFNYSEKTSLVKGTKLTDCVAWLQRNVIYVGFPIADPNGKERFYLFKELEFIKNLIHTDCLESFYQAPIQTHYMQFYRPNSKERCEKLLRLVNQYNLLLWCPPQFHNTTFSRFNYITPLFEDEGREIVKLVL